MIRALLLAFLLLAVEGGVQFWRHRELAPATTPVFHWKNAGLVTEATGPFGAALNMYRADRGMERFDDLPDGGRLQLLYLEWDDLEAGPFSDLAGHESEVCNITAGFTILESRVPRVLNTPGEPSLEFHYARLLDHAGRTVHAYKMPWIQGIGAWHLDSSRDRSLRFQRSFTRHRGAARVIQMAVFGAPDESTAWNIVQGELHRQLEWNKGG
jgi:hypothetical protein